MKSEYWRWREQAAAAIDLQQELLAIEEKPEEIQDRFYQGLAFGTGGLRGVLGAGTNRMNVFVVARASAGLAHYLLKKYGEASVAIGYDTRNKSAEFAQKAAEVFAAFGLEVYCYSAPMPTPAVSFAVRRLGCKAGLVITASHNPAIYNGYKVYGADGCQITQQAAEEILQEITGLDYFDLETPKDTQKGKMNLIGETLIQEFYTAELAQRLEERPAEPIKIVYTPLNGAGLIPVCTVLEKAGYGDVTVVPSQKEADGNFPTCPFPNPELPEALQEGITLCQNTKADLLLATDPDCDRVGVAVPHQGEYQLLSGNEVGVLLLDYICGMRQAKGKMPSNGIVVKTIVTTPLADKVAEFYNVRVENVLTGFKYIGEVIGNLEKQGELQRYIFGFEESCGYLSGGHVRDKDGVNACLLIADMAAAYKQQGITLYEKMQQLYAQFGYYKDALVSYEFPGEQGFIEMQQKMRQMRESGPEAIGGERVAAKQDYLYTGLQKEGRLPSSDVVQFFMEDGSRITMRPSGTEPKLKLYFNVTASNAKKAEAKCERYRNDMDTWLGKVR